MGYLVSYPLEPILLSVSNGAYPPPVCMASTTPTHRTTTTFNFPPHFPEESIERYPSLTRALANNYPGPRNLSANDTAMSSSIVASSVPPYPYPTFSNLESDRSGSDFHLGTSAASPTDSDLSRLTSISMVTQDRDVQEEWPYRSVLGAEKRRNQRRSTIAVCVGNSFVVWALSQRT